MVTDKNIIRQNTASVFGPVLNWSEQPFIKAPAGPDRGSFYILSPLDYIEAIQEEGTRQSNLFTASAGSDLRMSTLRPDPFSSAGIEARRSVTAKAGRDFLRLSSRAN